MKPYALWISVASLLTFGIPMTVLAASGPAFEKCEASGTNSARHLDCSCAADKSPTFSVSSDMDLNNYLDCISDEKITKFVNDRLSCGNPDSLYQMLKMSGSPPKTDEQQFCACVAQKYIKIYRSSPTNVSGRISNYISDAGASCN